MNDQVNTEVVDAKLEIPAALTVKKDETEKKFVQTDAEVGGKEVTKPN